MRQIAYEIEKNLHRLTSDLNQKINKEMDGLMAQALAYMNEELNMIEGLLSQDPGESECILERMNTIADRSRALDNGFPKEPGDDSRKTTECHRNDKLQTDRR